MQTRADLWRSVRLVCWLVCGQACYRRLRTHIFVHQLRTLRTLLPQCGTKKRTTHMKRNVQEFAVFNGRCVQIYIAASSRVGLIGRCVQILYIAASSRVGLIRRMRSFFGARSHSCEKRTITFFMSIPSACISAPPPTAPLNRFPWNSILGTSWKFVEKFIFD